MHTVFCYFCIFFFVSSLTKINSSSTPHQEHEEQILSELKNATLVDVRPAGTNKTDGPVEVKINMFIRSIQHLNSETNEMALQLTFREEWKDNRLSFGSLQGNRQYLTALDTGSFWNPDLFFSNEVSSSRHNLMSPNRFMRIYPDGTVLYSERLSLTLFCQLHLKRFPFDHQKCDIRMASYGFTTDDLIFTWKTYDPVQRSKSIIVDGFELVDVETSSCDSKTTTGAYSCLNAVLNFKRQTFYYYSHFYIPFFVLVLLSWIAFWLHPKARFTRSLIGVLTLFGILAGAQSKYYYSGSGFMSALGVWTTACFLFILGAFLEFVYVDYLYNLHKFEDVQDTTREENVEEEKGKRIDSQLNSFKFLYKKLPVHYHKIDFVARFLFPLLFLLFNIVYWAAFM